MSSADLVALREVIRRIEARARPARPRPLAGATLGETLGAEEEETEHGPLLVVRRRFPLDHRHGGWPLGSAGVVEPAPLALLARVEQAAPAARRLVYLDTETTGLAGGTGTYAFLVGAGFFDGDAFEVCQYFLRDLDEEPRLLAGLERLLRGFEGLVTYNGTGFDLPLLETRFVLARRRWPGDVFHLDLLRPARRLWRDRLDDCRLTTVERHVLGFTREGDLPGALIPGVYFEYLRRKAPGELSRVFDHNRADVLSLAALTGWVAGALVAAPDGDLDPPVLVGLGHLLEASDPARSEACYRLALTRDLASPGRERLLAHLAWREKRRRRWAEARALWEAVARAPGRFDRRPWEEMAKIDEHRRRDLAAARAVVEEARALAVAHQAPEVVRRALAHRLDRIERRLAGAETGLRADAGGRAGPGGGLAARRRA